MAEFCVDCWNKLNGTNYPKKKYIVTDTYLLCEGCADYKQVIVCERYEYYLHKLRFVLFPFKCIYIFLYVLIRILLLPYIIYKQKKRQKMRLFSFLEKIKRSLLFFITLQF